jgi:hypothetical protein
MAFERNPSDPLRVDPADDDSRRAARLDNELQMDPELSEGPANAGKITLFAVAIALVLGAVFYGLNTTSVNHAGTSPTTQTSQSSPPSAPPGMRDVTPRGNNTDAGVTTGAAPAKPQTPASPSPAPAAPSK